MSEVNKDDPNMDDLQKEKASNKVTVYIDDTPYKVSKNNNLLAGVLSQKLNLPYFCWHPSMGSVGACRQCAVTQYQDENDTRGRLVMACTTPVTDGMRISLRDQQSAHFREQVIGAMMTNHPHDCPVCAEGGECHLQDMTVMTGHTTRDYEGTKRTFTNQNLGELVGHEMNRCITCYRCVRFYKDYAGGKDFGVYGSKNQVYFGRQRDGALESEFSGNLVEVCPTGVFTNKVFSAHYTRKWDLQSAPSVCAHCSIGCNTSIGERYGSVRRVVNRFNSEINGYFLCDRGRYGIGFVNGEQRIRVTKGIGRQSPEKLTTLDVAKSLVHFRGKKLIGIGSARASLEANFYLKNLVGNENFSAGYSANEMSIASQHQKLLSQYSAPSLKDIENSDFVFIIGEDITQTSPRMALSVRQALRNASIEKAATIGIPSWQDSAVRTVGGNLVSPLFSLQSMATKLDDVCEASLLLSVNEIEAYVQALTHALRHTIQENEKNESVLKKIIPERNNNFIERFIKAFSQAKKPLVITGYSTQSASLLAAINELMVVLKSEPLIDQENEKTLAKLVVLPTQSNSVGLLSLIDEQTLSTENVLEHLVSNQSDGAILLEQELNNFSEQQLSTLRASSEILIVLDHSESRVSQLADIVMPVAAVSEGDGHYVNYQGLVQRYYQVHAPVLPIQDSWRWLDLIATSLYTQGKSLSAVSSQNTDDTSHSLADLHQHFLSSFTQWPINNLGENEDHHVARQTMRASGRTAQMANTSVHEPKVTQSYDPSLTFSMEGKKAYSTANMPFTWAPGWNSNQSITQFQDEVGGSLIHTKNNQSVSFSDNHALLTQWPIAKEGIKHVEDESEFYEKENTLIFAQKRPWYIDEWQSAFNPEFELMKQSNVIYVAVTYALKQGWVNGQVVKVNFDGLIAKIAILYCDEKLPEQSSYGAIDGLSAVLTNVVISLSEASSEEFSSYQQTLKDNEKRARENKASTLIRLKALDQLIPIRLVSGGLDDV